MAHELKSWSWRQVSRRALSAAACPRRRQRGPNTGSELKPAASGANETLTGMFQCWIVFERMAPRTQSSL